MLHQVSLESSCQKKKKRVPQSFLDQCHYQSSISNAQVTEEAFWEGGQRGQIDGFCQHGNWSFAQ